MTDLIRKSSLMFAALFVYAATQVWAASVEPLSQGVDFLAQEAAEAISNVPNGKFAVLQFIEEPEDPSQPLGQPSETAGLGIQLSQRLIAALEKQGRQTINRALLSNILRQNNFTTDVLGDADRLAGLLDGELMAIAYGRMRRGMNGVITIGVDLVTKSPEGEILHSPQGRSITVAMNGDMYALCSMNGLLEINNALAITSAPQSASEAAAVPARATDAPMLIVAPLKPQIQTREPQPYHIEVIVDGTALPCYKNNKGDFYLPAEVGKPYQVRLTNNTDEHVAVSLLIDGLSAIGKQRALPALGQNFSIGGMPSVDTPSDVYKYIISPKSVLTITGWQIDDKISRDFEFGRAGDSVAGRKDFWDYMGSISASFYPIISIPDTTSLLTRKLDEKAAGAKGLEIGTIEGSARKNQTITVDTTYAPNPAAVLGLFYESLDAINEAGMTLAE